jgi:hypothetical protein
MSQDIRERYPQPVHFPLQPHVGCLQSLNLSNILRSKVFHLLLQPHVDGAGGFVVPFQLGDVIESHPPTVSALLWGMLPTA